MDPYKHRPSSAFNATNSGAPVSNNDNSLTVRARVPPGELYATQLVQLEDMGFCDRDANIEALAATAGNVPAAVQRLLVNYRPNEI